MRLLPLPPGKQILRKIGLGTLADYSPHYMGHPFNQTVPRRVYRLHKSWLIQQDWIKEAEAAIGAYTGGDFIDVGASRGVYPLFLASKAREAKFLLLEPDPTYLRSLVATLQAAMVNNGGFVPYVMPVAVGAVVKRRHEFKLNNAVFQADILRVDDLVNAFGLEPCLVKIDVDGPEMHVLRGMQDTIARFRPAVLLELHPPYWRDGETQSTIFEMLPGYQFNFIWEDEFSEYPGAKCTRFLCVPKQ